MVGIGNAITKRDPAQHITDQRAIFGNIAAAGKLPVDILKRATRRLHCRCRTGHGDTIAKTVERNIKRLFKACQILVMLADQPRERAIILEFHPDGGGFHRLYHANPVMPPPRPRCSALLRSRGRK
jgi:hypothetical protein